VGGVKPPLDVARTELAISLDGEDAAAARQIGTGALVVCLVVGVGLEALNAPGGVGPTLWALGIAVFISGGWIGCWADHTPCLGCDELLHESESFCMNCGLAHPDGHEGPAAAYVAGLVDEDELETRVAEDLASDDRPASIDTLRHRYGPGRGR
jgi:hypothetical protein